jgi:hypothetical protein
MKFILAVVIGACCATQVYADDNCESAVDAADSMNVNQKDCDYTDEGLNGVLHKAFKQGSEGAVLETSVENSANATKQVAVIAGTQANKNVAESKYLLLQVDVDQWPSVALARTQLLPKAMEQCAKGFSVVRENYRPLAMGRISLSIEFSCLD